MAFGHGKDSRFFITSGSGTLTDISSYVTSVSWDTSRDDVDTTTLGSVWKTALPGIPDLSIDVEGVFDPTAGSLLHTLATAVATVWNFAPFGTSTGNAKYIGTAHRTDLSFATGVEDAVTFSASFHNSGSVTQTAY